jgi:hypothetical protein
MEEGKPLPFYTLFSTFESLKNDRQKQRLQDTVNTVKSTSPTLTLRTTPSAYPPPHVRASDDSTERASDARRRRQGSLSASATSRQRILSAPVFLASVNVLLGLE